MKEIKPSDIIQIVDDIRGIIAEANDTRISKIERVSGYVKLNDGRSAELRIVISTEHILTKAQKEKWKGDLIEIE